MRIYDISRELCSAPLYPGTAPVELITDCSMARGEPYNLSTLRASLHAGTHCDAFLHFCDGAADIAAMPLMHYIGPCTVLEVRENASPDAAYFESRLQKDVLRLLLKSGANAYLSPAAAQYIVARGIITIGTDALSVARPDEELPVHTALLQNDVAIIEQLDLHNVPEGNYMLFAPPVKIAGAEGAFCRAVLIAQ